MTGYLERARVADEMRRAVVVLKGHGLKQSARFCAEQLVGLATEDARVDASSLLALSDGAGRGMPVSAMEVEGASAEETLAYIESEPTSDRLLLASTYFELGEYLRCAGALTAAEEVGKSGLPATPPTDDRTSREVFLWAYSVYLAGEKRKEEAIAVASKEGRQFTRAKNPWLERLKEDLEGRKQRGTLRGLGPYALAMVLKEVAALMAAGGFEVSNEAMVEASAGAPGGYWPEGWMPPSQQYRETAMDGLELEKQYMRNSDRIFQQGIDAAKQARAALAETCRRFPWNWSAWLDLADLCTPSSARPEDSIESRVVRAVPSTIESSSASTSSKHVTPGPRRLRIGSAEVFAACHGARMAIETQRCEAGLTILAELHKVVPTAPFVLAQEALAHYARRDFDAALNVFERLKEAHPFRLDQLDVYSNVLYVKEQRAELSILAHAAHHIDKYRPETCCVVGNYYSLKRQHERAVLYFRRALRLDRRCLSAWTLMGHEFIELKNTAAAIEAYRRAVDTNARDYRAWYGLGQTYEMLTMHFYALFYYRKAASLRPNDGRMWIAIANCHEHIKRFDDAIQFYKKAAHVDDSEGHAVLKLAKLYRDVYADHKQAVNCFTRYLDIVSDQTITESVAEAILFIAQVKHKDRDFLAAQALLSRLLDFAGPERAQAQALLSQVRAAIDAGGLENAPPVAPASDAIDIDTSLPDGGGGENAPPLPPT